MSTKRSRSSLTGKYVQAAAQKTVVKSVTLAGRAKVSVLPFQQQRASFLIGALGSQSRLAELLEVSRSQPGKWSKGEESPSLERARELIDLDHVVARVVSWLGTDMTMAWLNGANAFLDGARPIDVLRTRGSTEVIDALDAEMSGAFA